MTHTNRDEHGAVTSVALVWTFPLLLVVMFMTVQTALWQQSNESVIAIAQRGAAGVARSHLDEATVLRDVTVDLRNLQLTDIDVALTTRAGDVNVTISADAPGIVIGTHARVHATATEPIEGWRSP
jgi:hypothetical protein